MKNIPVLMYHSISNSSFKLSVDINSFSRQMSFMHKLGYKGICLKNINEENEKKKFVITFDDGYKDIFQNAMPILEKFNFKATCFFVPNQIGKYNSWDSDFNKTEKVFLMDKNQINEWHSRGQEVASHTLDHEDLTRLNFDEKKDQILGPIDFFKKEFEIDIKSFSYPYGKYDDDSVKIAKKHYKFAVTTKRSRYKENLFDKLLIPRVPINSNTSSFKFLLKILTFYEDLKFKK